MKSLKRDHLSGLAGKADLSEKLCFHLRHIGRCRAGDDLPDRAVALQAGDPPRRRQCPEAAAVHQEVAHRHHHQVEEEDKNIKQV